MLRKIAQPLSIILIVAFLLSIFTVQAAKAEMISSQASLSMAKMTDNRTKVTTFLERKDVQQTMERQGVDPAEALARVNVLSDAELLQIAQKIDQLPAGGDGVGTVVGALLLVFFVLLITDILGLTHIFPFVKR